VKLSVSLPTEDVEFIDGYAQDQGIDTRSGVVHRAIRLLRATELGSAYEDAWQEWAASGEAELWDGTVADGLEQI